MKPGLRVRRAAGHGGQLQEAGSELRGSHEPRRSLVAQPIGSSAEVSGISDALSHGGNDSPDGAGLQARSCGPSLHACRSHLRRRLGAPTSLKYRVAFGTLGAPLAGTLDGRADASGPR